MLVNICTVNIPSIEHVKEKHHHSTALSETKQRNCWASCLSVMPHDKHVPCHRPWARNRRTSATSVVFGNDTVNHLLSYGSKSWYPRYHKIAIILYSSYKVVYIYICIHIRFFMVAGCWIKNGWLFPPNR